MTMTDNSEDGLGSAVKEKFSAFTAQISSDNQAAELNKYLDAWGDVAGDGTLLERTKRVIMYYASQGGRWTKEINKQQNRDSKKRGVQFRRYR